MQFVSLKFVMRIERRIFIIESDDEADVNDAILHAVNETAAECIGVERPAHRVNHCAGGESIFRKLPQLLHADGIDLRIFSGVEIEKSGELLCQCASRTL